MKKLHLLCLLGLTGILPLSARAQTSAPAFPYNTGVDNAGNRVPMGSTTDKHWLMLAPGSSTRIAPFVNGYPGAWVAAPADANYLSPGSDGGANGPAGDYVYSTKFDLTGKDISKVSLSGKWAADDTGSEILLNGSSVGITTDIVGFGGYGTFTVSPTANFVAGVNTLTFRVYNQGGPTGIVVEFDGNNVAKACAPVPAGLVSQYSGEGNASDSAGGNNGALKNGATFANGVVGKAFNLDASASNYVRIPDAPSLRPNKLTIEGWVNFKATNPGHALTIFGKAVGSSNLNSYVIWYQDGALHGATGDASTYNKLDFPWQPAPGAWYHVAYTFSGTDHSLFVNGVQVATASNTVVPGYDTHPVLFGADLPGDANSTPIDFFDGLLDEMSLYNRALSAAEVKSVYNAANAGKCHTAPACAAAPMGLVSAYAGDGNALDSVGSNQGALKNGATFGPGKVGQAFKLDGVDDFVEIPNSPSLNPKAITLEAWVNPSSLKEGSRVISKDLHASSCSIPTVSYSLEVWGSKGGRAVLWFTTADGAFHEIDGTSAIPTGAFTHIAATYDGTTAKVFVNGVLETSTAISGLLDTTSDAPVVIGNGGPGCRATNGGQIEFAGLIDEAGVYSRALSSAEIKGIYDADSAGKCDGPAQVTVTVPGTANPWLAGAPIGTTASNGNDTLKNAAPVRVPGLELTGGSILTFQATGGTRVDPNYASSKTPDGLYNMSRGPENGISAVNDVPADSLVGVFLGADAPKGAPAGLTYDGDIPKNGVNFSSFQPGLAQVFFIGDGKNASGQRQQIVAPAGATRLFLGSMDQYGWYNNGGEFNVTVTGGNSGAKNVQLLLGQSASTEIAPNGSAVLPGQIVTYVLSVYNGGTAKATGVTVVDRLPAHMTFVSASNGGYLNASKQVEFNLGTLAPGQANKQYLTIQARADKDAPLGQPLISNNYAVFAEGVDPVQGRDIISTLVAGPVLVETSTDVSSIAPGGVITYTFTVSNPRNVTAKNVQINFPFPENGQVTAVSGPGAVVSSTDVTFKLGDVPPGATIKLTVSVQLPYDANPGTAFELSAVKVTSATNSGQIAFFLPPVITKLVAGTTKPPQLGLIKIVPDGVTLRQLAFIAALGNNDLFASFKRIFPAVDSSDGIDALARIVNPDVTDATDKSGNLVQTVTTPGQPGGPAQTFITYALIYNNAAATVANDAFIQDRVPLGTTFVQGSAYLDGRSLAAGVLSVLDNGRTLKFELGTLGGSTHLITYKVRVLGTSEGGFNGGAIVQTRGSYIGTTSLFHTSPSEPEETDVTLRGVPSANVESFKIASNGNVGDIVGYDIFYHNTGTATATDLRIQDAVPAGTSLQRAFFLKTLADGQKKERAANVSRGEKIDPDPIPVGSKTATVTYHLGPVPPGEFGYVRLEVKVEPEAKTRDGLTYRNNPKIASGSFAQSSGSISGSPSLGDTTSESCIDCGYLSQSTSVSRVLAPGIPQIGIGIMAPLSVRQGDTFDYLIFMANTTDETSHSTFFTCPIPAGAEFVSATGQGNVAVVPWFGGKAASFPNVDAAGNEIVISPHSTLLRSVKLRARTDVAPGRLDSNGGQTGTNYIKLPGATKFTQVDPFFGPAVSTYAYKADQSFESARQQIASSTLAAYGLNQPALVDRGSFDKSISHLSPTATYVAQNGLDNLQLNNGALVVPLGAGNVLAAGPAASLVASGGGNVISNDGGSLVASGGGNLIKITNLISNDGGGLIGKDGKTASAILASLISQDGGSLVASGGGNLVASGGGNLISQDGGSLISNDGGGLVKLDSSTLVASGGGNLVASGGGNLVASGGGNLVASGGGNLVASGGGNLVASGGGNLVATGGGNLVASGGGNFNSSDASKALLLGPNGLVASGGGNLISVIK